MSRVGGGRLGRAARQQRGWPALAALALLATGLAVGMTSPGAAEDPRGRFSGGVRLAGEPPVIRPTIVDAENPCATAAGRKLPQLEVVVGEGGALANVFVRLEGKGLAAAAGPPPDDPIVIEQRGCIYYPRMSGARAGQTVRVVNRDDFLHNVRSVSEMGIDFNIGQPFAGMEFDAELFSEQKMLRLDCNFHPWMSAFIGVVEHPWFAVTGEDGRFELTGVPPGSYDVVLWHERFGARVERVSIEAGGGVTADYELAAGSGS